MNSLPYKIEVTNDKFTSRAGLTLLGQVFERLKLTQLANQHFPKPGSNRGYSPADFLTTFLLLFNEGGRCLEDVRHLHSERELLQLMNVKNIPSSDALGRWLHRNSKDGGAQLREVNRAVLGAALKDCKQVTLDLDATFVEAHKANCRWSYVGSRGYMPMIGTIAETGQVVAAQLRAGNVPPAARNLEFIQDCEAALPAGVRIRRCRIDAAGYQVAIINHLEREQIGYAIRAKMSTGIRDEIAHANEKDLWQPLKQRDGRESQTSWVYRTLHVMTGKEEAVEMVIQRTLKQSDQEQQDAKCAPVGAVQLELPLGSQMHEVEVEDNTYVCRAIITNLNDWDESRIVHWYNARGEHSENRIKELKNDFGARHLPCRDFDASAFYFEIAALAYNVFVLLRFGLPVAFECARVTTVRLRLFDIGGKIVRHARQISLKLNPAHYYQFIEAHLSLEVLLPEPAT